MVCVKWNKEVYEVKVEDDGASGLKAAVEARTGVPRARQKLLAKGAWVGVLKDEMSLGKLKPEQQVTLIGSAEVVSKPAETPKFVEDMAEAERARSGLVLPAGLENLGNTCYMNSTLQCLRFVPELRSKLAARPAEVDVTASLATTYAKLDASTRAVAPAQFVHALRTTFPQFAQRGRSGGFAQQDAEELYSSLLAELARGLGDAAVDDLFGLDLVETLACDESEAEPPVVRTDKARKLICNIQGGVGQAKKIDYLNEGLRLAMTGTVVKRAETLGRDAAWTKTQTLAKLPPYLCVQFMRFFWKPTPGNEDHAGVKCKIMRPVLFPETLDVLEFAAPDLKTHLTRARDRLEKIAEQSQQQQQHPMQLDDDRRDDASSPAAAPAAAEDDDDLAKAIAMSMADDAASPPPMTDLPGLPPDFTGDYQLFAIVTHKGRSADGGHYMGWVRQDGDKWLVFDDDLVTESSTEFVVNRLKGGGDEHMAYLAFYRAKSPQPPSSPPSK